MREFEHPNFTNDNCSICNTQKDLPVVLVGLPGTEVDGIMETEQVHSDCWRLWCKMHDIECEI